MKPLSRANESSLFFPLIRLAKRSTNAKPLPRGPFRLSPICYCAYCAVPSPQNRNSPRKGLFHLPQDYEFLPFNSTTNRPVGWRVYGTYFSFPDIVAHTGDWIELLNGRKYECFGCCSIGKRALTILGICSTARRMLLLGRTNIFGSGECLHFRPFIGPFCVRLFIFLKMSKENVAASFQQSFPWYGS